MPKKCKYGLTLAQCNEKWEPTCQGDDHNCELVTKRIKNIKRIYRSDF